MKTKVRRQGFPQRLVGELWLYPDGSQIVELSTKAPPADAIPVAAKAKAFLQAKGVDLSGERQTKTKTPLQFFAGGLEDT